MYPSRINKSIKPVFAASPIALITPTGPEISSAEKLPLNIPARKSNKSLMKYQVSSIPPLIAVETEL